jgi:iron transport multicopper oxidase
MGCYADPTGSRALTDLKNPVPAANVTNDSCAKACAGYSYYGTEYGQECYCGYDLNAGSAPATSGCSKPCSGDNQQICGGANRLNLYKSTNPPVTVGNSTGIQYLGCYSEATNGKALYDKQLAVPAANVTVEACMQACSNYSYFGVERGNQCFCGNTIRAGSALIQGSTVGKTGCNMLCQGNSTEFCGGVNRLNMYAKLM